MTLSQTRIAVSADMCLARSRLGCGQWQAEGGLVRTRFELEQTPFELEPTLRELERANRGGAVRGGELLG
jgi:hypothetical protein